MVSEKKSRKYSAIVLLFGALAGLGLAFFEAIFLRPLPEASIASVNGEVISKSEFNHVLFILSQGRANPLSADEKQRVLEGMIDNALLVQRANQLGLAQSHPELRLALIQAMISFILDNADRKEPSQEALKDFFQKNKILFQVSERLQVRRLYFFPENKARALQAGQKIKRGVAFSKIKDDRVIELPRQVVPLKTLHQYLGKAITAKARQMKVGQPSEMISTDAGYFFLLVEKKFPALTPTFEAIKSRVKTEWRVHQDRVSEKNYIKALHEQASIKINQ